MARKFDIEKGKKKSNNKLYIIGAVVAIIVAVVLYFLLNSKGKIVEVPPVKESKK